MAPPSSFTASNFVLCYQIQYVVTRLQTPYTDCFSAMQTPSIKRFRTIGNTMCCNGRTRMHWLRACGAVNLGRYLCFCALWRAQRLQSVVLDPPPSLLSTHPPNSEKENDDYGGPYGVSHGAPSGVPNGSTYGALYGAQEALGASEESHTPGGPS